MAKTKISEFSATPANNTDIDSINIAEGCAPSGINDAIRELMAQLKDFQTGAVGDSFNGPIGATTASTGAFTTLSASSTTTLSGLTASTALALDASKNVVSVTNTGTGNNVLATSPTLVTPVLGVATGTSFQGIIGNVTPAAGSFTTLGASSTATLNTLSSSGATLTGGTINGMTVGASTPSSGAFTTVTASTAIATTSGGTGLTSFTSGGVVYASSSSALATGSALTFDGTNLGVGIASATSLLDVRDGVGSILTLGNTGNFGLGEFSRIKWKEGSTQLADIGWEADTNELRINNRVAYTTFYASNAEALRLTSTSLYTASGITVGFGLSNPSSYGTRLAVSGAANVYGDERKVVSIIDTTALAAGVGAGISFFGVSESGGGVSQFGSIKGIKENATSANYAGALAFVTSNSANVQTERMRLDSAGNLKTFGTISVGNATPSTSGAGITFPATQSASSDANTLDDYEEGTWSPSIGGSTTYTAQDGYYTKCGNVVTVTGRMQVNLLSGNANTYQITNLPFTSKNTSNGSKAGGGSVGYWSSTAINVISLQTYVETNTTNLVFQYLASAASAALTATIFGNSTDVYFTATYLT